MGPLNNLSRTMSGLLTSRAGEPPSAVQPPLPQAAGYVVIIVMGFLIAIIMMLITHILKRTAGEDNKTTEMFMTANRTVGTGLTASAVISSWLWSTAILASSLVGYNFGVAGPFWFAAGYVAITPSLPALLTLVVVPL